MMKRAGYGVDSGTSPGVRGRMNYLSSECIKRGR